MDKRWIILSGCLVVIFMIIFFVLGSRQSYKAPEVPVGTVAGVISTGEDQDSVYRILIAFSNSQLQKVNEYDINPAELYKIRAGDKVVKANRHWMKVLAVAQIRESDKSFGFKSGDWIAFTKGGLVKIVWAKPDNKKN